MGYQNRFSAGPGSAAVLRKRGAEIEKIMEAPARKSAITWLWSGGAVAVEIRRRCMRSLLHEIFNEGAGFGKKPFSEEKCRLFGVWGGVRFVHPRFTFLSSRIIQKRKLWLAEMLELPDESLLARMLGSRWWFHFGKALCEVIMPEDFYRVGPLANRQLDALGLRALARDWAAWPGEPSPDVVARSQFNLFYDIGAHVFGQYSRQALDYAMYFMERRVPVSAKARPKDPQRHFGFPDS
jgi:hypothetical protein